jgi:hypothetical protein
MVKKLLNMLDGQEMLTVHGNDDSVPYLRNENLRLVLDFHVRGGKNLGVHTLGQTGKDVSPRCHDGGTDVERSGNREDGVQENVPEVGIEEEENDIGKGHQGKNNSRMPSAKLITEQERISETRVDIHDAEISNRITE